tara:strand:- start:1692 stop:1880 length:189 start_codon:yes stop_codon:yes gene_type:complete
LIIDLGFFFLVFGLAGESNFSLLLGMIIGPALIMIGFIIPLIPLGILISEGFIIEYFFKKYT